MRTEVTLARRIVVKLGTHVVTHATGEFALGRVGHLVEGLVRWHRAGCEVILVSSGAVGLGREVLGLRERPRSLGLRQACAAAGQGRLMAHYDQAFSHYDITSAQVLLGQEDLGDPDRTLCVRTTLLRLLELRALPILNENDSVSIRELIGHPTASGGKISTVFGDNDELAARVALCVGADLLVILTDVDGVFTANPNVDPNATRFDRIDMVSDQQVAQTKGTSDAGTGGMASKLRAAKLAQEGGIDVIIARGAEPGILDRCLAGDDVGTWIVARDRKSARLRRRNGDTTQTSGAALIVNDGAMRALLQRKASLLPIGVLDVVGNFDRAAWVEVRDISGRVIGHGQVSYDADACRKLKGQHSDKIGEILGWVSYDALINRQNMDLIPSAILGDRREPANDSLITTVLQPPLDID